VLVPSTQRLGGPRPSVVCLPMTTARIRALLAATAVITFLAHGLSGHGLPQMSDEMAGATAVFCLLIATAVAYVAATKPDAHHPAIVADAVPKRLDPPPHPPLDGRARASPVALQRFQN